MNTGYYIKNQADLFITKIRTGYFYRIQESPCKKRDIKILLIGFCVENTILTINQTIYELIRLSAYSIDFLNICGGIPKIKKDVINRYNAIIIHNTASYTRKQLEMLERQFLKEYEGIKILMKQDEHFKTNEIVEYVQKNDIKLVLSIWDEETARKVYSSDGKHPVEVMNYLTGYVPDHFKTLDYSLDNREIDIGYRGSIHSLLFGRLCYEKAKIGEGFEARVEKNSLRMDISNRWEDRINGKDWLDFLGNCKAVLGVESGTDTVDCDGSVSSSFYDYVKRNPNATDEEVLNYVEQLNCGITYRAISPRHFEAAACKTLQIMFEDRFQDIFVKNRHYVPLNRDYSNIEEVVEKLMDNRFRKQMVECAFEEIVLNEKYSFKTFVEKLDAKIETLL